MKKIWFCTVFAFTLSLTFVGTATSETTKIRFAENWILNGTNIPEYVAQEKGWYAQEGLGLTINRGFGAADTFKRVEAGSLDIGLGVMVSVALGRGQGAKVKIIQLVMATSPYGLAYLKGIGINKPKDLDGRRVAIPGGSSVLQFWPAFAKKNGIDMKKNQLINMGPGSLGKALAHNRVDAVDSYLSSLPVHKRAAAQQGREVGFFLWSDYGLSDMYGGTFIARDDTIQERPQIIQKFVRATIRGSRHAHLNPKEAVDIFIKYNPGRNRKQVEAEWKAMKILSFDENTKTDGYGAVNKGKMERALQLIEKYIGLKDKSVKAGDLYTNQFVDKTPRQWRFFSAK